MLEKYGKVYEKKVNLDVNHNLSQNLWGHAERSHCKCHGNAAFRANFTDSAYDV